MFLRQSTIQTIRFGPFLDATDGVTEEIALTITQALRRLSKDGAAFAQTGTTGNATHDSDGWYSADLSAADTNTVGELRLNVQVPATHLPVWDRWWVIEEAVYDALFGAAAAGPLQSTVAGRTLDIATTGEAGIDLGNTLGNLVAADFGAASLNGKGNWNIGKTGYDLAVAAVNSATVAANAFQAANFQANWLAAAGIAADAIDKIRDGLLPTQNIAFNNLGFIFVAASDGKTPVTGATSMAVTRSIDGAAFGAGTGTLAEIGNGAYQYDASAADMNGGVILFRFTATGGTPGAPDDRFVTIVTGGGV